MALGRSNEIGADTTLSGLERRQMHHLNAIIGDSAPLQNKCSNTTQKQI